MLLVLAVLLLLWLGELMTMVEMLLGGKKKVFCSRLTPLLVQLTNMVFANDVIDESMMILAFICDVEVDWEVISSWFCWRWWD